MCLRGDFVSEYYFGLIECENTEEQLLWTDEEREFVRIAKREIQRDRLSNEN